LSDDLLHRQVVWAHRYNGYKRIAGSDALERVLAVPREDYARTGAVPEWCGIDLLRGWAFYLARWDRFAGGYILDPGTRERDEWRAVMAAIARHPAVRPTGRPPLE
jgi:hypothetical protein